MPDPSIYFQPIIFVKNHGLKLNQIPCLGILVTTHMIYPLVVGLEFVIVTSFQMHFPFHPLGAVEGWVRCL